MVLGAAHPVAKKAPRINKKVSLARDIDLFMLPPLFIMLTTFNLWLLFISGNAKEVKIF